MDIDLDWCLTCEKRVDGPSPYCSPQCGPYDDPIDVDDDESVVSDIFFSDHASRWLGNGSAGIEAWAREIPAGPPAGPASTQCSPSASEYSFSSNSYRPQLLTSSHRAVPPALCKPTPRPQPAPLSTPIVTPQPYQSANGMAQTNPDSIISKISLKSALTESSIATPASTHPMPISRKPSLIGDMYNHVRSWVSPSPAIFVPAQYQQQRHYPPPLPTVEFTKYPTTHPDPSWMSGPETKPPSKRPHQTPRARSRLVSELALLHDEHPSFRTRGRRASRAAA